MRTVIKELWVFSIAIWKQHNSELHGTDGAISMEQRRKETANEAVAVYQSTIGNLSQTDGVVLHRARIEEILKWTKEHLDAYLLASADVIIDQRKNEPG
jgi:predicted dehydrogenase